MITEIKFIHYFILVPNVESIHSCEDASGETVITCDCNSWIFGAFAKCAAKEIWRIILVKYVFLQLL